jgi:hypothetical protein
MPFSVVVLCVLCIFVVNSAFFVPLLCSGAFLHQSCMVAARMSSCSQRAPARYRRLVGHLCEAFSACPLFHLCLEPAL